MNSHSSREQAVESSERISSAGPPSGMSNGTTTASECSPSASQTDSSPWPRSLAMCVSSWSPVPLASTGDLRTWLAQAFPASRSASQEDSEARTTSETCGQPLGMCFARYDQTSRGLRMSQASLLQDIANESSETWPRWGLMRDGACFQLPPLELPTAANESSLLPTVGANEYRGTSHVRFVGSAEFRGAKMAEGLRHGPNDPAYLNPQFADWAMGWPMGWSALEPLGMGRFQSWCVKHGGSSHE